MEVETFKRVLRELAEREPAFLRDIFLEALRGDGRAAEQLAELLIRHPEVRARLAEAIASSIAIPLNVATRQDIEALRQWTETQFTATRQEIDNLRQWTETQLQDIKEKMATKEDLKRLEERMATKEDLKRLATKEDLKRVEDKMATKEQFEALAVSVEESGRDWVQFFLEQRGFRCTADRLQIDGFYEFDVYCNAGVLTAVGEAKVRAGGRDVEKVFQRVQSLARGWPEKISGRPVPTLYTYIAEPSARQKAKELKIWLIENRREITTLEEVLEAGYAHST